jgi:nucleotide-binding universal stress UspA family protein
MRPAICSWCRGLWRSQGRRNTILFISEPEQEEDCELLRRAVEVLRPLRVTIVVSERPFAPAIAASRGEQPRDAEAWLDELTSSVVGHQVKVEGRVVTSITGYTLCDIVDGLEADLLVVKAEPDGSLSKHMDWLYQVIPARLLLVRDGLSHFHPRSPRLHRL